MTSVIGIGDPYALTPRIRAEQTGDGFAADLDTAQTDALLQTTKQYDRWRDLRQKNPESAKIVADLVVRRHALLEEARAGKPVNAGKFDELTGRLRRHGIFLYRTDQFTEPVFQGKQPRIATSAPDYAGSKVGLSLPYPLSSTIPLELSAFSPESGENSTPLPNDPELQDRLVRLARENYLGVRSNEKDCYNFLVEVLEDSGISYYGSNGIRERLVNRAAQDGVSPYRYLTGEDLTSQLCSNPFRLHVPKGSGDKASQVWRRLAPGLAHGALLSISSQEFGHTGIVARKDGRWTFLNSARTAANGKRGYLVKEEELRSELQGWLDRAGRRDSFLDITLGVPEQRQALRFGPPEGSKGLTAST